MADVRHALTILAKHTAKTRKVKTITGDAKIAGGVHSTATHGAVSVAIGGANQGNIHIKVPAPKPSRMAWRWLYTNDT